jgi:hypothetical protein
MSPERLFTLLELAVVQRERSLFFSGEQHDRLSHILAVLIVKKKSSLSLSLFPLVTKNF